VTQIAHDPVPEGSDMTNAPMESATPDAAKAAGAFGVMDLKSTAPEPAAAVKAAAPAGSAGSAAPAKDSGKVTLVPVPPLGGLVLSPLEEGGKEIVITEDGTEVSAADAERAYAVAMLGGYKLREL
jgi:hypothetical protein